MVGKSKFLIADDGRVCSRCKCFKIWDEYYKSKTGPNGYCSYCKNCSSEYGGHKKRKKRKIDDNGRECTRCGKYLPWGKYYSHTDGVNGKLGHCKDCVSALGGWIKRYDFLIDEKGRECSFCSKYKRWANFSKNINGVHGYSSSCKECCRVKRIARDYGISIDEYKQKLKEQKNVCAICKRTETAKQNEKITPLCVDHNHNTGKVRGLLCSRCNKAIGAFEDSIETLISAIAYLQEYDK